jgi:hypothetical protein
MTFMGLGDVGRGNRCEGGDVIVGQGGRFRRASPRSTSDRCADRGLQL